MILFNKIVEDNSHIDSHAQREAMCLPDIPHIMHNIQAYIHIYDLQIKSSKMAHFVFKCNKEDYRSMIFKHIVKIVPQGDALVCVHVYVQYI
jgi:hypothetical protein